MKKSFEKIFLACDLFGAFFWSLHVPSDVINVYQPPVTDICITFKSPLMRGCFRWYQSRKLAVERDLRIETPFSSLSTLGLFLLNPLSTQTLTTDSCPVPDG